MNAVKSGFVLGFFSMIGALAYTGWRKFTRSREISAASHPAVTQWEGEGGNVPEVSVQAGQQARSHEGTAVLPDTHRIATNPDQ
jgi:hypothetical protein